MTKQYQIKYIGDKMYMVDGSPSLERGDKLLCLQDLLWAK